MWAGVTAGRTAADLLALAAAWPFDLVVRDTNELGGCLAAERLGVPHAVVEVVAPWPGDGAEAPLAAPLAGHRAALGLPPDPALAMLRRYLHLSARPPSFRLAPPGPTDHAYRAPLFDRAGAGAAPGWAAGPLAPPVVYATLGTVVNRAVPGLFAAILAGTRAAAGTLVLTVGPDGDPAALGPQPAHVHVERYVPQTDLLPRCDLVVTHGGSGTLLAALAHGLPAVVIPIAADQPRNAERVAALGLGRVVGPEARTAAAIGAAVRAVLGDPAYRARARACQAELGALPGVEHAVALLERLCADRQPILRAPDRPSARPAPPRLPPAPPSGR